MKQANPLSASHPDPVKTIEPSEELIVAFINNFKKHLLSA